MWKLILHAFKSLINSTRFSLSHFDIRDACPIGSKSNASGSKSIGIRTSQHQLLHSSLVFYQVHIIFL